MLRSYDELYPRDEARRRLGVPDDKLALYLSAGGGGDPTAHHSLAALVAALRHEPDLHLVIGAGPLFRGAPLRGAHITWLNGFHTMQDFRGLDCAISAAGFNAFHELLHAGVPTAFFAQEKIADEQARRVRVAAAAGCALALEPGDSDSLRQVIGKFRDASWRAETGAAARQYVPENAARAAAYEILATVLPRAALEEAHDIGTEAFFVEMAQLGVTLEDFTTAARPLREVEAGERRDLVLEFFRACSEVPPPLAARLGKDFGTQFVPPVHEDAAQDLLDAAATMVLALAQFSDEPGARSLIQTLGANLDATQRARPQECAAQWAAWLKELYDNGASLPAARARLLQTT